MNWICFFGGLWLGGALGFLTASLLAAGHDDGGY